MELFYNEPFLSVIAERVGVWNGEWRALSQGVLESSLQFEKALFKLFHQTTGKGVGVLVTIVGGLRDAVDFRSEFLPLLFQCVPAIQRLRLKKVSLENEFVSHLSQFVMGVFHSFRLANHHGAANDLDQLVACCSPRQGLERSGQKGCSMDELETNSSLRLAKVRHLFDIYDADGNGVLEKFDFQSIAENFARARGLKDGSESYQRLRDRYLQIWSHLQREADENGDGKISFEEMLSYHNLVTHDPSLFHAQVVSLTEHLFDVLDSDSDGTITRGEYFEFASCLSFQVNPEDYETITQGEVFTKKLLRQRLSEFYFSELPDAPGNRLFGHIPEVTA